jgi:methionyl-tRNA formyltransferase
VPGTIVKILGDSLVVASGGGFLKITEIQPESGKRMGVCQCGHNMNAGEIFG